MLTNPLRQPLGQGSPTTAFRAQRSVPIHGTAQFGPRRPPL